jgi:EmrB/QacA subfamily drug resistance transporter
MTTAMIGARGGTRRVDATKPRTRASRTNSRNPWVALWAMMVGFFMILLDSTIVAVANPSIMAALHTGYDTVIWVTSAYLLAYAVPLLVAGRLGDRFGPKNLYLIGLTVFTAASLWCGLSGTIGMLIAARVVQGIGAALLTPQTLSTITQTFRPERRGVALSVWGATAGVATLVGPLAGGVLVDGLGWEWIFFVNVPIGVVGLALAAWLIPMLPTHTHRFDLVGVGLSGAGVFLIVFALQEGQPNNWAPWIWAVIVAGVGFLTVFVYWQSMNTREPLIPLQIFRDPDFRLANLGVAVIGFAVTAMVLPVMFYLQTVCGLSPTHAALLTAPMAIASGLLAPFVGTIVDRSHPRSVVGFGFSVLAIGLTWLSIEMTPATPIWRLILPFTAMGVGMAFIWSPLAATATRNLPPHLAGASSGVYSTTTQVGAVLGSAGMAAFMTSRIIAELPPMPDGGPPGRPEGTTLQLPEFLREPFAAAMSQSTLLPAFIALFGIAAAMFMVGFATSAVTRQPGPPGRLLPGHLPGRSDGFDGRAERMSITPDDQGDFVDDDYDDDAYVEYTLSREPDISRQPDLQVEPTYDDTEPLAAGVEHPRPAPAVERHSDPVESWPSLLDEPGPAAEAELIGFAHNGFHVDDEQRFRPIADFLPPEIRPTAANSGDEHRFLDYLGETDRVDDRGSHAGIGTRLEEYRSGDRGPSRHQLPDDPLGPPPASDRTAPDGVHSRSYEDNSANEFSYERFWNGSPARHHFTEDAPPPNRHYRADPDDSAGYGRHSSPD